MGRHRGFRTKADRKIRRYQNAFQEKGIQSVELSKILLICNCGILNGMNEDRINEIFGKYGFSFPHCVFMVPNASYCFVEYLSEDEAKRVYESISGQQIDEIGHPIYLLYVDKVVGTIDSPPCELPDGLKVVNDFITEEEEEKLLKFVYENVQSGPDKVLKHRLVKHYGYEFLYETNNVDVSKPLEEKIPQEFHPLLEKFNSSHFGEVFKWIPDQLTINVYKPGQGIPPHVDTHSAFDDVILSFSLGSNIVMDFKRVNCQSIHLLLRRRSLLILESEARYAWSHGIRPRKLDTVQIEDETVSFERGTRISLTFRRLRRGTCDCPFPEYCDSLASNKDEKIITELELDDVTASRLEVRHVHQVYDEIAIHFSHTRYRAWPGVRQFVEQLKFGSILLDVGCGNGKYFGLAKHSYEVGCDRSRELARICASRGHQTIVCDCLRLPFRSNFADACISIAVIHHLATKERRMKALSEIMRVLRPGGRALIYVWAKNQWTDDKPSAYVTRKTEPRIFPNRKKKAILASINKEVKELGIKNVKKSGKEVSFEEVVKATGQPSEAFEKYRDLILENKKEFNDKKIKDLALQIALSDILSKREQENLLKIISQLTEEYSGHENVSNLHDGDEERKKFDDMAKEHKRKEKICKEKIRKEKFKQLICLLQSGIEEEDSVPPFDEITMEEIDEQFDKAESFINRFQEIYPVDVKSKKKSTPEEESSSESESTDEIDRRPKDIVLRDRQLMKLEMEKREKVKIENLKNQKLEMEKKERIKNENLKNEKFANELLEPLILLYKMKRENSKTKKNRKSENSNGENSIEELFAQIELLSEMQNENEMGNLELESENSETYNSGYCIKKYQNDTEDEESISEKKFRLQCELLYELFKKYRSFFVKGNAKFKNAESNINDRRVEEFTKIIQDFQLYRKTFCEAPPIENIAELIQLRKDELTDKSKKDPAKIIIFENSPLKSSNKYPGKVNISKDISSKIISDNDQVGNINTVGNGNCETPPGIKPKKLQLENYSDGESSQNLSLDEFQAMSLHNAENDNNSRKEKSEEKIINPETNFLARMNSKTYSSSRDLMFTQTHELQENISYKFDFGAQTCEATKEIDKEELRFFNVGESSAAKKENEDYDLEMFDHDDKIINRMINDAIKEHIAEVDKEVEEYSEDYKIFEKLILEDEDPESKLSELVLPIHESGNQFEYAEVLVPWKTPKKSKVKQENTDENKNNLQTHLRYYHMSAEGELDSLFENIPNCRILESYYEQGNWCILVQKKQ